MVKEHSIVVVGTGDTAFEAVVLHVHPVSQGLLLVVPEEGSHVQLFDVKGKSDVVVTKVHGTGDMPAIDVEIGKNPDGTPHELEFVIHEKAQHPVPVRHYLPYPAKPVPPKVDLFYTGKDGVGVTVRETGEYAEGHVAKPAPAAAPPPADAVPPPAPAQ